MFSSLTPRARPMTSSAIGLRENTELEALVETLCIDSDYQASRYFITGKRNLMNQVGFWIEMYSLLDRYDLRRHSFSQAWEAGALALEDIREYAIAYYPHVAFFPLCLQELVARLADGDFRTSVVKILSNELGQGHNGRSHLSLWLEFAIGVGTLPKQVIIREPQSAIRFLNDSLLQLARCGQHAETLAALYLYYSQREGIGRMAGKTLRIRYGLDDLACGYFDLQTNRAFTGMMLWREELQKLNSNSGALARSLASAELVAKMLWRVLDAVSSKLEKAKH